MEHSGISNNLSESEALLLDGLPAHHTHCFEVGVLGQLDALLFDLLGQLSSGSHHHRQRSFILAAINVLLLTYTSSGWLLELMHKLYSVDVIH